jgi:hypothetical protein
VLFIGIQRIEAERGAAEGTLGIQPAELVRGAVEGREGARAAVDGAEVVVGRAGRGLEVLDAGVGQDGGKVDLLAVGQRQLAVDVIQIHSFDDGAALVADDNFVAADLETVVTNIDLVGHGSGSNANSLETGCACTDERVISRPT